MRTDTIRARKSFAPGAGWSRSVDGMFAMWKPDELRCGVAQTNP
jgi:hypothetical protein